MINFLFEPRQNKWTHFPNKDIEILLLQVIQSSLWLCVFFFNSVYKFGSEHNDVLFWLRLNLWVLFCCCCSGTCGLKKRQRRHQEHRRALILALKNTRLGSKQLEFCRSYQPQNKQTNPKPEGQSWNNSQARTSELLVAREAEGEKKKKTENKSSTDRDGQGQKALVNKGMKVKEMVFEGRDAGCYCKTRLCVCAAAAGRPSWPGCHCVPCQSTVDGDGQEEGAECRRLRGGGSSQSGEMNLCWSEIKRKSHNIR